MCILDLLNSLKQNVLSFQILEKLVIHLQFFIETYQFRATCDVDQINKIKFQGQDLAVPASQKVKNFRLFTL